MRHHHPIATRAAALLLLLGLAAAPAAAAGPYVGADAFLWEYDEEGFETAEATGLRLRLGYEFTPYFSIEGQYAEGGDDDVMVAGVPVNVELDRLASVFLRPQIPLSEHARVYGLVGYSEGKLTASALGVSASEDDSDMSIGLGLEVRVLERLWLGGDYVRYLSGSAYDADALALGARVAF